MSKIVIIPRHILAQLRAMRPDTHEIGGLLRRDDSSKMVTSIMRVEGEKCRDENGKLLKDKICTVTHPPGPVVFHTHPRANRPSSTDLRMAVEMNHEANFVVTPLGVWGYSPSPELRSRFAAMTDEERRCAVLEFRFLGHSFFYFFRNFDGAI